MGNKRVPFGADTCYHVYNHGNGDDIIFRSPDNYFYFLKKYDQYISPIADTYAYCLMPNHFHLLLRIKTVEEIAKLNPQGLAGRRLGDLADLGVGGDLFSKYISRIFSNFLNAYAKAFNKMYHRRGSLFLDNIKRKPVTDDDYFTQLIYYIHYNPVHHQFVKEVTDWAYNSYEIFLSKEPAFIERKKVLDLLNGEAGFKDFHRKKFEKKITLENEFN